MMKLPALGISRPYRGVERRRSTPEEREQYALDHRPPQANGGWRGHFKKVGWAVLTAVVVGAAIGLSRWTVTAVPFYWSLQARMPALEQRVNGLEANKAKLDRILEILEEQRKERKQ